MTYFEEKLNVTIELIPMSWANYIDRNRIWISSGDMPNMIFWDFNYSDYNSYVEQGLNAKMPDDLYERYPNLGEALKLTQIADFVQEKMDGELYTDIAYIDFDLKTFTGAYFDKVKSIDVSAELCEVILMDGDIETNWQNWVNSKMAIIEPTIEELNETLLK